MRPAVFVLMAALAAARARAQWDAGPAMAAGAAPDAPAGPEAQVAPEAAVPVAFPAGPEPDRDPPVLLADLPVAVEEDAPLVVRATAHDRSGVARVVLHVRFPDAAVPRSFSLVPAGDGAWRCEVRIPYGVERIEAWLSAWDGAGNGPTRLGSPAEPQLVEVRRSERPPDGRRGQLLAAWPAMIAAAALVVIRRAGRARALLPHPGRPGATRSRMARPPAAAATTRAGPSAPPQRGGAGAQPRSSMGLYLRARGPS